MSKRKCVVCGKDPAEGLASINDRYYCHGDTAGTTCYMVASWEASGALIRNAPYELDDGGLLPYGNS